MEPYYSENLTNYFDHPAFGKMAEIIDPYTYRERLTMPKMVVSATGDEFFAPDDSYAWFDELAKHGLTYLRLLPNAEHSTVIPGLLPQKVSSPHIGKLFALKGLGTVTINCNYDKVCRALDMIRFFICVNSTTNSSILYSRIDSMFVASQSLNI